MGQRLELVFGLKYGTELNANGGRRKINNRYQVFNRFQIFVIRVTFFFPFFLALPVWSNALVCTEFKAGTRRPVSFRTSINERGCHSAYASSPLSYLKTMDNRCQILSLANSGTFTFSIFNVYCPCQINLK